jgi:hypothetical protein
LTLEGAVSFPNTLDAKRRDCRRLAPDHKLARNLLARTHYPEKQGTGTDGYGQNNSPFHEDGKIRSLGVIGLQDHVLLELSRRGVLAKSNAKFVRHLVMPSACLRNFGGEICRIALEAENLPDASAPVANRNPLLD